MQELLLPERGEVGKMKGEIEKALLIQRQEQLGGWDGSFGRIQFGCECCERLLPSKAELLAVKKFCGKKGIMFSFVTPYLTDAGLRDVMRLLPLLGGDDELVVNDFGLLDRAKRGGFHIAAGRLLNRQYRDPRIPSFKGKVPHDFYAHLQQSHAGSKRFRKLLLLNRVERVELDNLPQGIGTKLNGSGLSGSLHFPFLFVSTGRMCLTANCDKISFHNKIGIFPCSMECKRCQFALRNKMFPAELFLFGNSIFSRNNSLPAREKLLRLGIDRIVTNKALQL